MLVLFSSAIFKSCDSLGLYRKGAKNGSFMLCAAFRGTTVSIYPHTTRLAKNSSPSRKWARARVFLRSRNKHQNSQHCAPLNAYASQNKSESFCSSFILWYVTHSHSKQPPKFFSHAKHRFFVPLLFYARGLESLRTRFCQTDSLERS